MSSGGMPEANKGRLIAEERFQRAVLGQMIGVERQREDRLRLLTTAAQTSAEQLSKPHEISGRAQPMLSCLLQSR